MNVPTREKLLSILNDPNAQPSSLFAIGATLMMIGLAKEKDSPEEAWGKFEGLQGSLKFALAASWDRAKKWPEGAKDGMPSVTRTGANENVKGAPNAPEPS